MENKGARFDKRRDRRDRIRKLTYRTENPTNSHLRGNFGIAFVISGNINLDQQIIKKKATNVREQTYLVIILKIRIVNQKSLSSSSQNMINI